jgi:hypothetical protein
MKMPKGFNKWSLLQQETYFNNKLQEIHSIELEYRRILASIRGGQKVELIEMDRPDEILMKA